jgi:hypothetical protein
MASSPSPSSSNHSHRKNHSSDRADADDVGETASGFVKYATDLIANIEFLSSPPATFLHFAPFKLRNPLYYHLHFG